MNRSNSITLNFLIKWSSGSLVVQVREIGSPMTPMLLVIDSFNCPAPTRNSHLAEVTPPAPVFHSNIPGKQMMIGKCS